MQRTVWSEHVGSVSRNINFKHHTLHWVSHDYMALYYWFNLTHFVACSSCFLSSPAGPWKPQPAAAFSGMVTGYTLLSVLAACSCLPSISWALESAAKLTQPILGGFSFALHNPWGNQLPWRLLWTRLVVRQEFKYTEAISVNGNYYKVYTTLALILYCRHVPVTTNWVEQL